MIKPIKTNEIPELARLHKENLPSFLSAFPLSFIEKFYLQQLTRENQTLLGAFENEKLLGFIFGTDNVEKLYDDFIAENPVYFYLMTLKTLLFHPKFILLFLGKFISQHYKSSCTRQLVYIAVDSANGKKGFGQKLLDALEDEWRDVEYYELEVESKNPANKFYKKNRFFLVHEFNNWVERKYLLGKSLK